MSKIVETHGPMHTITDGDVNFDAPAPKLKPGQACMTTHARKMTGIGIWCWIGEWEILDNA